MKVCFMEEQSDIQDTKIVLQYPSVLPLKKRNAIQDSAHYPLTN